MLIDQLGRRHSWRAHVLAQKINVYVNILYQAATRSLCFLIVSFKQYISDVWIVSLSISMFGFFMGM